MKQKQILILIPILLLTLSGRTWKNFPKYYKSLAYVSFFNSFYYYLCKRYLLWEFPPEGFHWRLLRSMHIFFITPMLVLAFLSKFPESLPRQLTYLIKWTVGSTMVEHFAVKENVIIFKHGWNIFWSGLIYLLMYSFSYLLTKKPFVTWFLSFYSLIFFLTFFKVPFNRLLLKGPFFFLVKTD
ncbi:hypothetical protein BTR23_21120 [Alkalihalophilus pseudofirmus]|nr:hypothetical protein BTR23_21120 [Alkalihalophilus pseudofirmus]